MILRRSLTVDCKVAKYQLSSPSSFHKSCRPRALHHVFQTTTYRRVSTSPLRDAPNSPVPGKKPSFAFTPEITGWLATLNTASISWPRIANKIHEKFNVVVSTKEVRRYGHKILGLDEIDVRGSMEEKEFFRDAYRNRASWTEIMDAYNDHFGTEYGITAIRSLFRKHSLDISQAEIDAKKLLVRQNGGGLRYFYTVEQLQFMHEIRRATNDTWTAILNRLKDRFSITTELPAALAIRTFNNWIEDQQCPEKPTKEKAQPETSPPVPKPWATEKDLAPTDRLPVLRLTKEQEKWICNQYSAGVGNSVLAEDFNRKWGVFPRAMQAHGIASIISILRPPPPPDVVKTRQPRKHFTAEESNHALKRRHEGWLCSSILEDLKITFPAAKESFTLSNVGAHLQKHPLAPVKRIPKSMWKDSEEARLLELFDSGLSTAAIFDALTKDCADISERALTKGAVAKKLSELVKARRLFGTIAPKKKGLRDVEKARIIEMLDNGMTSVKAIQMKLNEGQPQNPVAYCRVQLYMSKLRKARLSYANPGMEQLRC